MKTRIVWNSQGGELDSVVVTHADGDKDAVKNALIKMIRDYMVNAGDSFIIEEITA